MRAYSGHYLTRNLWFEVKHFKVSEVCEIQRRKLASRPQSPFHKWEKVKAVCFQALCMSVRCTWVTRANSNKLESPSEKVLL